MSHNIIINLSTLCLYNTHIVATMTELRHTNDQKITGSNPGWICHSGALGNSISTAPSYQISTKWFSGGSEGIVCWSVLCANVQPGYMLPGKLKWNQEWIGPVTWGITCSVTRAVSLNAVYNPAPLPSLFIIYITINAEFSNRYRFVGGSYLITRVRAPQV